MQLEKPFDPPIRWFGGKRNIASEVWLRLGEVECYIEPFFGSGAVFFSCPYRPKYAVLNDVDGFLCNFFRSTSWSPEETARWADWPMLESDIHARAKYLLGQHESLVERLESDPNFYDPRLAGWWYHCHMCNIAGWTNTFRRSKPRVIGGLPSYLRHQDGDIGQDEKGFRFDVPIYERFAMVAQRLRNAIILCGDFERVLCDCMPRCYDSIGVFLDPPYDDCVDCDQLYKLTDTSTAKRAYQWAIEHGDNPTMRIAVCGYEGGYEPFPDTWECLPWTANGGFCNHNKNGRDKKNRFNRFRERIWFSPHCIKVQQMDLFGREG
ncbi:MAG: DNA adenine methylase [candidate division WOR-3 bacterium]